LTDWLVRLEHPPAMGRKHEKIKLETDNQARLRWAGEYILVDLVEALCEEEDKRYMEKQLAEGTLDLELAIREELQRETEQELERKRLEEKERRKTSSKKTAVRKNKLICYSVQLGILLRDFDCGT
jgi:hypothetical protein